MAITFDNDGKPAYMFKQGASSSDGVWYAVGAKVDTSAAYEFTGANSFTNTVLFDDAVTATNGWNNFLNPAARDAALATPVRGTICFVRQDAGGSALNQIQSYDGSAWVASGDVFGVTAGTGISGGGTSGTVTVSVDTAVVATTSNTLTMSGKTLTSPVLVSPEERTSVSTSAPTSTTNIDAVTAGTHLFTANTTSNVTLNIRGDGSTTLNTLVATGDSISIAVLLTNGGTAYYPSTITIDGTTVTPKWQGGTAPSSGNTSSIDAYVFNIIKTASATYTVLASQTKFA
jgi:hypothetical protein